MKGVCSQEKDICADNFDNESQVKPNTSGFKQSKSCSSGQEVQTIHTSVDSTLQPAGITHINKTTLPTKGSNLFLVARHVWTIQMSEQRLPFCQPEVRKRVSVSCGIHRKSSFMCHRSDPECCQTQMGTILILMNC